MKILLQRWMLSKLILQWEKFKKAESVYFLQMHRTDPDRIEILERKIFLKLFKFLFKKTPIEELPRKYLGQAEWESNYESIQLAKDQAEEIKKSLAYKVLRDFVGADEVLKFFQANFTLSHPKRILFEKLKQSDSFDESWTFMPKGRPCLFGITYAALEWMDKSFLMISISVFLPLLKASNLLKVGYA